MKMALILLLLSMNTVMAAEIKNCQVEGSLVKNVITLNEAGTQGIQKILDSSEPSEIKKDLIKRLLFIETVSIGDGNSVCELAVKNYDVKEEKCLRVMKSSDLMSTILEESDPSENISLECKIAVTAKLLMQFNM